MNCHVPPSFRSTGIEVVDPFLDRTSVEELVRLIDPLLKGTDRRTPGVRRVLQREPRISEVLRRSPVPDLIEEVGGTQCRVVRALLFDKSGDANWMVPWHQDATIAVCERADVAGYGLWAVKDGEHHCRPPLEVLESLITVRIHLDACPAASGPLRVIAGSHQNGLLDEAAIANSVDEGPVVVATTDLGGVVLTTPLAIHSSSRSTDPNARRRVLHLDCSSIELPEGLKWAESWHLRSYHLTCPIRAAQITHPHPT